MDRIRSRGSTEGGKAQVDRVLALFQPKRLHAIRARSGSDSQLSPAITSDHRDPGSDRHHRHAGLDDGSRPLKLRGEHSKQLRFLNQYSQVFSDQPVFGGCY